MAAKVSKIRARATATLRSPLFWGIAIRVVYFLWMSPISFRGDAADYQHIATNLAAGLGFSRCPVAPFPPTAQRPPLFSLLLAGLYFLGAGNLWGSFVLNLASDLLSMRLLRLWAEEAGFTGAGARAASWIIALCPLLVAYCPYSTTENLSITLFLAASVLTFRLGRKAVATSFRATWPAVAAGLFWGLLALCRSYYLLFPVLLFAIPASPRWRRGTLALLLAFSFAAPSVWVARNYVVFGKPAFSQGAAVGWQAYQGLCFTNFDWWDPRDVQKVYAHPVLSRMLSSYCTPDDQMAVLDHEVRDEVIQDCVLDRPLDAALNTFVKGVMLFINWGQLLPYTEIPGWIRWPINLCLTFYWWCVVRLLWVRRREARSKETASKRGKSAVAAKQALDPVALRYAGEGILYVLAVTLPFSVDSRYLLGPFVIALCTVLESAGGAGALIRLGLPSVSRSSRRGSRAP